MAKKYKLINGDGEQARFTDSDIELLISVVNREVVFWYQTANSAQPGREFAAADGAHKSWAALLAKLKEID